MNEDKETPKPQPDPQPEQRRYPGYQDPDPFMAAGGVSGTYGLGRFSGLQAAAPLSPGEIQAITSQHEAREKAQRAQYERAEKIRMAFELTKLLSSFPEVSAGEATPLAIAAVKDIMEAFPE